MRETARVPSALYGLYGVAQMGKIETEWEQVRRPKTPPTRRKKHRDGRSRNVKNEREREREREFV